MSKGTIRKYEENLGTKNQKLEEVVREWGRIRSGLYMLRYDHLTNLLRSQIPRTSLIADVGSGDGYFSHRLTLDGHQVVGVELASSKVGTAHKRSADPYFVVGDAENLPLSKESIDAAVCVEVIEHVPDPKKLLATVFEALKPGGLLVVTTPSLHMKYFRSGLVSPLRSLASLYNPSKLPHDRGVSEPDREGRRVIDRAFSLHQIWTNFVEAGFEEVHVRTVLFLPIFASLLGSRALPAEQMTWSRIPVISRTGITLMATGRKPN